MSLVPNESLRYRSDYPGDTRCADCSDCKCRKEIEAETVQRCIDAAKPILHSHIYKGTEETYEELKDAEQELIEALEAQK